MSKRTTIYVLFKEYSDPNGRRKSVPFIHDSVDYLAFPGAIMQDWSEIYSILKYFNYEPANKYYDENNLEGLLEVARLLPDEYPTVLDTIMSEIQSEGLTSWRTNPSRKTSSYCFSGSDVTDHLIGDMAQREVDRQALLLHNTSFAEYEPCVLVQNNAITSSSGCFQVTTRSNTITLITVNSIMSLHQWLSLNRFPKKNYKFNPKHGDASHGAQLHSDSHGHLIRSAQLLTDGPATQYLLNNAVGETIGGDLWFYDDSNGCFIYFENQGDTPQHEFHGYHLRPGDKNFDKICVTKLRLVQPRIP